LFNRTLSLLSPRFRYAPYTAYIPTPIFSSLISNFHTICNLNVLLAIVDGCDHLVMDVQDLFDWITASKRQFEMTRAEKKITMAAKSAKTRAAKASELSHSQGQSTLYMLLLHIY
jgi:hypothetical protein